MADVDLSEFEALATTNRKKRCQIAVGMEQVDGQDLINVQGALLDKDRAPAGAIRDWFRMRGIKVTIPAVTHHRDGNCTCAHD